MHHFRSLVSLACFVAMLPPHAWEGGRSQGHRQRRSDAWDRHDGRPSAVRQAAPPSQARSALVATREPPPPDQLAALFSLTDKIVTAGMLNRHSRNAELSARAALKAEVLFTGDSLVVAYLRMNESKALVQMAASVRGAEQDALIRRSWSALLSAVAILQRQLTANTLLPGTVRKEESDYHAHMLAATYAARNEPIPPPAELQIYGSTIGYDVLLDALFRSLDYLMTLFQPLWPDAQRKNMESFVRALCFSPLATDACSDGVVLLQVFQALGVIPQTAGLGCRLESEDNIVAFMAEHLSPQNYEPACCAAVLRKWRSDAVCSVLRARGALQTGIADHEKTLAEFRARQREDIAKHGLRECALPSCAMTEKSVKEFAHCSGCRSVVYCCAEHQGLHWTKHKKACNKKQAEQLAEEIGAASI